MSECQVAANPGVKQNGPKTKNIDSVHGSHRTPKASEKELKELSLLNGAVNKMPASQVKSHLEKHGLQLGGTVEVLRKRLKNHYRHTKLGTRVANTLGHASIKYYDFLCIIDFEATCTENMPADYVHEIIEFPAVLLCTHSLKVVKEFHHYCRPQQNKVLTAFCRDLTGITQEQVDEAEDFPTVLARFEMWLLQLQLGSKYRYAIVTDSPYDMGRFLVGQCKLSEVPFPMFGKVWANICKIYSNYYNCGRMKLATMLNCLGMEFEGRQHCGLDDARNIARVTVQLLRDGACVRINERLKLKDDNNTVIICISQDEFINRHHTRNRSKKAAVSVQSLEEQLNNLEVDPALENSLENMCAQKLLKKFGRKKPSTPPK